MDHLAHDCPGKGVGKHLLLEEKLPSVAFVLLLHCAEPAKGALSFPQLPQNTCVKVTETRHCYQKKKKKKS